VFKVFLPGAGGMALVNGEFVGICWNILISGVGRDLRRRDGRGIWEGGEGWEGGGQGFGFPEFLGIS
jgi:hypothetical protein